MSEPLVGQVKAFAGNFAPRGYAFCDGELLSISANAALFSILGTTYGSDGRTTFGLPDLRSRAPIHAGNGPGLSNVGLGQHGGSDSVALAENNLPSPTHQLSGINATGTVRAPAANTSLANLPSGGRGAGSVTPYGPAANLVSLAPAAVGASAGGSAAHENRQPFLGLNYIVALMGVYPERS